MPWSVNDLPPSVEAMNLTEEQIEEFVAVANSILEETGDEGRAIAGGLSAIGKRKNMSDIKKEVKNIGLEIKELTEDGTFEGYASIFGNVDSYNDIVQKGAFLKSLKRRKPKLLWQHKSDEPIGIYQSLKEDDRGLLVKGKLAINTAEGKRAYELLKMGALDGLSIGYAVVESTIDDKKGIRTLIELELFEVSLVTFPANPQSLVNNVKEDIEMTEKKKIEQFDCMKDFENFLKEPYALTSQERKTFISQLKEHSKQRDVEEEQANKRDAIAKDEEAKKLAVNLLKDFIKQIKD